MKRIAFLILPILIASKLNCQLIDTIEVNDEIIIGTYKFEVSKIETFSKDNHRIYHMKGDNLLTVYDEKINKTLFFDGDKRNASRRMYEYFHEQVTKKISMFDNYLIKVNLKGRVSRQEVLNADSLISETSRYYLRSYVIFSQDLGMSSSFSVHSPKITDRVKQQILAFKTNYFEKIIIVDKRTLKEHILPDVKILVGGK